jgi:hypothetical protein
MPLARRRIYFSFSPVHLFSKPSYFCFW